MKLLIIATLSFGLFCSQTFAACTQPKAPAILQSKLASEQELKQASQQLDAYMLKASAYLRCLDKQSASSEKTVKARQQTEQQMKSLAERFNTARRSFLEDTNQ